MVDWEEAGSLGFSLYTEDFFRFVDARGHVAEEWQADLHTSQDDGAVGHLFKLWPTSLQKEQTRGIHGLETRTRQISPESNWTLTASGKGFLGSMIVKTLATSKLVKFAVEGCKPFGSPTRPAMCSNPSSLKNW